MKEKLTKKEDRFVFWNDNGQIRPHLLYEFFEKNGVGKYYADDKKKKNSEPVIVKIDGNIVSEVNVNYILAIVKDYILECTAESGESGPILDALHRSMNLFGEKNLKLLPTLKLDFISDKRDAGYLFFKNGVLKITKDELAVFSYDYIDGYVWENNIVGLNFQFIDEEALEKESDFYKFLGDLTTVKDEANAAARLKALKSAIGYLLHRYKDGTTNQAIVLMDVYVNGTPNGGSGKTLLVNSIGKIRNLSLIDGKKYDQREWFALSSVVLDTEVLLFDDVEKNFNFEQIFPLLSTGLYKREKYKNHTFIPHEKSPKVAITTNYAINGDSSSHKRRRYEFEVSATYNADFSPRDKFGKNFFDDWDNGEWNLFFNTMVQCMQLYLHEGLVESEPINVRLTKLVYNTSDEFVEFAGHFIKTNEQLDKKQLYDEFIKEYPEHKLLKQRAFTMWLREWGKYKNYRYVEGHSGDTRYIIYSEF